MTHRRTLVSFSLALAATAAGCRLLRPIDPNPPGPEKEAAPASEPAAQPTQPVAQPTQPAVVPPPATSPTQAPVTPAPQIQSEPPVVATRRPGSLRDGNIAAMVLASNNTDISY